MVFDKITSPQLMSEMLKGLETNIKASQDDVSILERQLLVLFGMVSMKNKAKARAELLRAWISQPLIDGIMGK